MTDERTKKILICRTDKIGDVILTLPVISNLRKAFPGAVIDYLAREYTKKILEGNPGLNTVLIFDPVKHKGLAGIHRLSALIESGNYDIALVLYPRFTLAASLFKAGVKTRIGTAFRWYSFLFNERVRLHRKNSEKHELEYNLDLLEPLKITAAEKSIKLFLTETERTFAKEFLLKNGLDGKKVITVHPGAAVSVLNWPAAKYAELIEELGRQSLAEVVLVEGRGEEAITEEIMRAVSKKPVLLSGSADIRQIGAVLELAVLHISSNTGTMHVAAAVGTPTLSFFNPVIAVSPKRWGPWGNKSIIISPAVENCKKCSKQDCRHYNCMDKIEVREVLDKIREAV